MTTLARTAIQRHVSSLFSGLGGIYPRLRRAGTECPRCLSSACQVVVVSLLFVASAEAASRNSASVQRVYHPTEENIPSRDDLAGYIGSESVNTEDRGLQEAVGWFSGAEEVLKIGVRDGAVHDMFGKIEDVAVNGSGDIFVLDFQQKKVILFSSDGSYIQSIGGPGAGPGEFEFPEAIGIDSSDRVIVMDAKLRVSIFALLDTTVSLESTITLAYPPKDMCIDGSLLYLAGAWAEEKDSYVHVYTTSGEHVRSFGSLYKSNVPFLAQGLSHGPIACGRGAESLLYMFGWMPVIHGYAKDGERRWTSMLADFSSLGVVSYGASEVRYEDDDIAYDIVANIVAVSGSYAIVQTKHMTPKSRKARLPYDRISTYVIALKSGDGMYVGDRFPPIQEVRGNRIYAARTFPFPQVLVYETESVFPR